MGFSVVPAAAFDLAAAGLAAAFRVVVVAAREGFLAVAMIVKAGVLLRSRLDPPMGGYRES